ncbi:MAG: hypothetical protein IIC71_13140, partial [Acidobacteria bacterium]|nr:hypothetical protein [Acidobacteriota bacterium]
MGEELVDEAKWHRARLIPVAGIRGHREAEQRVTSALLAVLSVVRDLSIELLAPLGASSALKASVETFTEVTLDYGDKRVRPDGVIRVSYGKRTFTTIVEVKTGNSKLDKDQVDTYRTAAGYAKFDHVLTISNEIATSGAHPIQGLHVKRSARVQVSHLSWVRILTTALKLKNHKGVDDPEQAWILGELVRYLQHPASGVLELVDMGSNWTAVRDGSRAGTLKRQSDGTVEIAKKLDGLHVYAALMLSSEVGENVEVVLPKSLRAQNKRIATFTTALISGEAIEGTLRIPHTASDIKTAIDLKAQLITISVDLK